MNTIEDINITQREPFQNQSSSAAEVRMTYTIGISDTNDNCRKCGYQLSGVVEYRLAS